ncbi:hypothetical protein [Erwinia sorbitola]|uniref:Uncharacterized protein n=1 Tax=Erwinia sorbitola TaxID=2681984 RepID=A0A6I6ES76_9GAMM|nr:hypothetical protein [Erwinia sorbitola]QGU87093.1 hypothetical protein GN242_07635 [Erwinia sorbitola]
MNSDLGELLDTFQRQITDLRTQQIVQDSIIRSLLGAMPEEVKSQIKSQVKKTLEIQPTDEAGVNLKEIAQDYLARAYQIK